MAKKKGNKKAVENKPSNKAEKIVTENKVEAKAPEKYNGYIVMGGMVIKMSEAKARLLV